MIVGHCAIQLGAWDAINPTAKPLQAPKNLHPMLPETVKLTKKTWMVMHFLCALQYKVTGKFQRSKF